MPAGFLGDFGAGRACLKRPTEPPRRSRERVFQPAASFCPAAGPGRGFVLCLTLFPRPSYNPATMKKAWRSLCVLLTFAAVGRLPAAPPDESPTPPALSLQPPRPTPPGPSPKMPAASPELVAYRKQVQDAVGRSWYQAMKLQAAGGTEVGTVKIRFYLLPTGAIEHAQVVSGKAKNPRLAKVSEAALRAATFPPMLPAVIASLTTRRGSMEVDFTFTNK